MKTSFMKLLMAAILAMSACVGVAQNPQDGKQMVKRVEAVLCPDQKPIGQSAATATPKIRVVKVKDFSDAHAYLLRMCPQREIREEKKGGNLYYSYTLPDGKGQLVLTDKVKSGEIAVLEVEVEGVKEKLQQVRFVK